eukprot:TRINITY_DN794_c0_g2_i1.p1 TRINITY_DN794_c0_g2~~TRINITY_DN794_c0_g2_i1.p1  ORF type:complete len:113 (+),score=19.45 TRINITY_DN794_c0_g2_i1:81-419(+)
MIQLLGIITSLEIRVKDWVALPSLEFPDYYCSYGDAECHVSETMDFSITNHIWDTADCPETTEAITTEDIITTAGGTTTAMEDTDSVTTTMNDLATTTTMEDTESATTTIGR